MYCDVDDVILVSAANENIFASLVIYHKLPLDCCLYVPIDKEYRDLVVDRLRGSLREDQIMGCFTVEERTALLKEVKKSGQKKSNKVARVTKDSELEKP